MVTPSSSLKKSTTRAGSSTTAAKWLPPTSLLRIAPRTSTHVWPRPAHLSSKATSASLSNCFNVVSIKVSSCLSDAMAHALEKKTDAIKSPNPHHRQATSLHSQQVFSSFGRSSTKSTCCCLWCSASETWKEQPMLHSKQSLQSSRPCIVSRVVGHLQSHKSVSLRLYLSSAFVECGNLTQLSLNFSNKSNTLSGSC